MSNIYFCIKIATCFVVFILTVNAQTEKDVALKRLVFDETTPVLKPLSSKDAEEHYRKEGHDKIPIFVLSHAGAKIVNQTVKIIFMKGDAGQGHGKNKNTHQIYSQYPTQLHNNNLQGQRYAYGFEGHDKKNANDQLFRNTVNDHEGRHGDRKQAVPKHIIPDGLIQHEPFAQKGHKLRVGDIHHENHEPDHYKDQEQGAEDHMMNGFRHEHEPDSNYGLESNLLHGFGGHEYGNHLGHQREQDDHFALYGHDNNEWD